MVVRCYTCILETIRFFFLKVPKKKLCNKTQKFDRLLSMLPLIFRTRENKKLFGKLHLLFPRCRIRIHTGCWPPNFSVESVWKFTVSMATVAFRVSTYYVFFYALIYITASYYMVLIKACFAICLTASRCFFIVKPFLFWKARSTLLFFVNSPLKPFNSRAKETILIALKKKKEKRYFRKLFCVYAFLYQFSICQPSS